MPKQPKEKVENVEFNLHELMARKKIRKVTDLAEVTGISRTVLYDLSNGNKRSVRLDTLVRICKALDCEIGDLIKLKREV
ncbi:helix-turn-helix domain-containing protein [Sediminibacillus massiliensis]|uniref:helix-turn-helix domain-containing protein n=1 Tax=Sediminibacillus massiliensis TaxID=1926277 RepID=UPI0009887DEC|nr:helix-turn-helix transcriptional regulator [Sediminibacillus massiliensis]